MRISAYYFLFLFLFLGSCFARTPEVQTTSTKSIQNSDKLSFINVGLTTREDVLLELGNPSNVFEKGRILTYQFLMETNGKVHIFNPRQSTFHPELTYWVPEIYSLVLIFGSDNCIDKYSIVTAK